ncbi:MAG TPA: stimulus-sensing domain-containing protein [Stellaceae bacterium]|nr:stimulus-sensing domain-containing protein [Stellaceae bacterium]
MALDIATATPDTSAASQPSLASAAAQQRERRYRRGRLSPLTRRILAVNVVALALLGLGLLYLGEYQQSLVAAEIESLKTQGQIFAAALGEGAVSDVAGEGQSLVPELGRDMMRRLVEPTHARARLFDAQGALVGDTRLLRGPGGVVQIQELPPPGEGGIVQRAAAAIYDFLSGVTPWRDHYRPYRERENESAADYPEVGKALAGDAVTAVREDKTEDGLILTAAVPVQRYKQVLGVVLLSKGSAEIEQAVRAVRFEILKVFAMALGVTVLLSIYLAGTIAQPIRRLAAAAERVRRGHGRQVAIPDLSARRDEIGDLAGALRDMTSALWQRMDAIERFAADVAHEIKNPLTSLKSAVETAARVEDPAKQRKLLALVQEDVERLDRLITDISDASRLDAELSRGELTPVAIEHMLEALVEVDRATAGDGAPQLVLVLPEASSGRTAQLAVIGIEGRLVQVFRNLIANAISFSPPGGIIRIAAQRRGDRVEVTIEDEGPGIPEGKLEAIFDRFYSERPAGEKFGTHSGLGLSISKQIVEAHRGTVGAENRRDSEGAIVGARFTVRLPGA